MQLFEALNFCCHFHDAYTGEVECKDGHILLIPFPEIFFGEKFGYEREGVSEGRLILTLRGTANDDELSWLSHNRLIDVNLEHDTLYFSNGEREVRFQVDYDQSSFAAGICPNH